MSDAVTLADTKSVGIVGAGIAGLTLALELQERGFAVTLYEAAERPGGKAGSTRTANGWVREHVNKNYSAHYYCLPETLGRIPCGDNTTILDRLVPAQNSWCQFADGSEVRLRGKMGMSRQERGAEARRFVAALAKQGVAPATTARFLYRHARLVWMCEARRQEELSGQTYAHYVGADSGLPNAGLLLQLIEITAAANSAGPARAAAEQTLRIFGRAFNPHGFSSMINNLDGPSDERLIAPWLAHLQSLGVVVRCNCPVAAVARGAQAGLTLADGTHVRHDAVKVATATAGLRQLLPEIAPSERCDKWANGFYFPLSGPPTSIPQGELRFCLGSAWSLIVGARQFGSQWYLWLAASNATALGPLSGLPYPRCPPEQLQAELLHQAGFAERELIQGFFAGQGLEWQGDHWHNAAPLYAATMGEKELDNTTPWPGVFVAGEATRTIVKVATMEKANESAKRCAAAICAQFGLAYPASKYTYDPFPAETLRVLDAWREDPKLLRQTALQRVRRLPGAAVGRLLAASRVRRAVTVAVSSTAD